MKDVPIPSKARERIIQAWNELQAEQRQFGEVVATVRDAMGLDDTVQLSQDATHFIPAPEED